MKIENTLLEAMDKELSTLSTRQEQIESDINSLLKTIEFLEMEKSNINKAVQHLVNNKVLLEGSKQPL